MLSLIKHLSISLFLILHIIAFSQKSNIQNIEQIILSTDRSIYISGEPIWYCAAYSMSNNTPLTLSKVLYVELFNSDNKVVSSQKIAIDNNTISGRIIIPENVVSGYYILRAYTRYQENFPAWQFTSLIIRVINPNYPLPSLTTQSKTKRINMALMHNGNIAFRIKKPLVDKIDSIKLFVNNTYVPAQKLYYSNGLGSFYYIPKPHDSISLLIMLSTGDSLICDSTFVNIPHAETEKGLYLRFLKNNDRIIKHKSVLPGNPISINLAEIDSIEYPIVVSLVMKGTYIPQSNLLPTYLIDNPLYINGFLSTLTLLDDEILNQARIVIALKQKSLFRLFNKEHNKSNIIIPEISGLTIQGRIINAQTKKPIHHELVYASVLGSEPQFHATRSMQNGSFIFPLNFCNNTQDIFISTDNSKKNKLEIQIDDGFCPTPPSWSPTPFIIDTSYRELITKMYFNYQVMSIFNIHQSQTTEDSTKDKSIFGDNLTHIKLSDYIQMSNTPEVFNELVPNVRIRKKDGRFKLVVFDNDLNIKYENPLIFVDNMPYNDIDKIMKLQPTEIEQINIINHEYIYGNNVFKGIIMIYTNTGNFAKLPLSQDGVFVEYQTLSPNIRFVPLSTSLNSSDKPNFTTTAYWQPINYTHKIEQFQVTTPSGVAGYELFIISMANQSEDTD